MKPVLSIIVPHGNSKISLDELLDSLNKQITSFPFEVLIIQNFASHRLTGNKIFSGDFQLTWLSSARGANCARQKGVEASTGDVLLFLDDDCVIQDPLLLQKHFDLHQHHPELTAIGGFYTIPLNSGFWTRAYDFVQRRWLEQGRLPENRQSFLLGGHSSYKKAIFKSGQAFDQKLIFGGTETEFQVRIQKHGARLALFSELHVEHRSQVSWISFIQKAFAQGVGDAYLSAKHPEQNQFLFVSATKGKGSGEPQFRKSSWIYKCAFEAGKKYHKRTQDLSPVLWFVALTQSVLQALGSITKSQGSLVREFRNLRNLWLIKKLPQKPRHRK
jgi:glycosyltransferase involved in cell wall biosynthesis